MIACATLCKHPVGNETDTTTDTRFEGMTRKMGLGTFGALHLVYTSFTPVGLLEMVLQMIANAREEA